MQLEYLEPVTKEQLDAMSPKDKRIRIAQDVIASLQKERIHTVQGIYTSKSVISTLENNEGEDAQKVLSKIPTCEACAKGAILICAIDRFNKIKITSDLIDAFTGYINENEGIIDFIAEIFSEDQWHLIEVAFERSDVLDRFAEEDEDGYEDISDEAEQAIQFGLCYDDSKDRLIAIMQNIIDNDGIFCP